MPMLFAYDKSRFCHDMAHNGNNRLPDNHGINPLVRSVAYHGNFHYTTAGDVRPNPEGVDDSLNSITKLHGTVAHCFLHFLCAFSVRTQVALQ